MFTKCPHLSPKLYHKSFLRHRSLSLTKTLEKRRFHQNDPPLPAFEQTQPRYISKYSIVLASHFRSLILQITHVHPNLPNTKHVQWTCFFVSTRLSWAKWIQKDEEQRETDSSRGYMGYMFNSAKTCHAKAASGAPSAAPATQKGVVWDELLCWGVSDELWEVGCVSEVV